MKFDVSCGSAVCRVGLPRSRREFDERADAEARNAVRALGSVSHCDAGSRRVVAPFGLSIFGGRCAPQRPGSVWLVLGWVGWGSVATPRCKNAHYGLFLSVWGSLVRLEPYLRVYHSFISASSQLCRGFISMMLNQTETRPRRASSKRLPKPDGGAGCPRGMRCLGHRRHTVEGGLLRNFRL